jgi:hypothetical protein
MVYDHRVVGIHRVVDLGTGEETCRSVCSVVGIYHAVVLAPSEATCWCVCMMMASERRGTTATCINTRQQATGTSFLFLFIFQRSRIILGSKVRMKG